jgi:hypothetical protein
MNKQRVLAGLGLVVAFFVPAWWRELGAGLASAGGWLIDAYTVIYVEGEIMISACFALVGLN